MLIKPACPCANWNVLGSEALLFVSSACLGGLAHGPNVSGTCSFSALLYRPDGRRRYRTTMSGTTRMTCGAPRDSPRRSPQHSPQDSPGDSPSDSPQHSP